MPTHEIPPDFRGDVHLFKPPYAIGSVPRISGHAVAYRWRSLPRVHRHRASSPQGSSSNECCLSRSRWTIECAPLFSHIQYWFGVGMLKVSRRCSTIFRRVKITCAFLSTKPFKTCTSPSLRGSNITSAVVIAQVYVKGAINPAGCTYY